MATPSITDFQSQLLTFLEADAGITAITSTRIYNGKLPQLVTFPALLFQVRTETNVEVKDAATEYKIVRVQFTCFAAGVNTAETLYKAVYDKFDRFVNESNTTKFHETFYKGRQAQFFDEDEKIYSVATDFDFHIK